MPTSSEAFSPRGGSILSEKKVAPDSPALVPEATADDDDVDTHIHGAGDSLGDGHDDDDDDDDVRGVQGHVRAPVLAR